MRFNEATVVGAQIYRALPPSDKANRNYQP